MGSEYALAYLAAAKRTPLVLLLDATDSNPAPYTVTLDVAVVIVAGLA